MKYNSVDLFAGCGGLTEGMRRAGFSTKVAIELESEPARVFRLNHADTSVMRKQLLALMIGNALSPAFSFFQSRNIAKHIETQGAGIELTA